jgi:hypothetical protein
MTWKVSNRFLKQKLRIARQIISLKLFRIVINL